MNKIIVEVSVGELLDKISILEIKQDKIKDPEKLNFINNEHSILKNQFENNRIGKALSWHGQSRGFKKNKCKKYYGWCICSRNNCRNT